MDTALETLKACAPNTECRGIRLLENPFYLKLCPKLIFNPDDVSLVRGMYLPLDYWRLIEADLNIVGLRGGRNVTFENVGRYLDNSDFVGARKQSLDRHLNWAVGRTARDHPRCGQLRSGADLGREVQYGSSARRRCRAPT